ncbi:hypothetical protein ACFLWA_07985 [Chloroflexota bacterium]
MSFVLRGAFKALGLVPVAPGPDQSPVKCSASFQPERWGGEMAVGCKFDNVPVGFYTVQVAVDGGYYSGYGEDVMEVHGPG